jgi:hypothetical protein
VWVAKYGDEYLNEEWLRHKDCRHVFDTLLGEYFQEEVAAARTFLLQEEVRARVAAAMAQERANAEVAAAAAAAAEAADEEQEEQEEREEQEEQGEEGGGEDGHAESDEERNGSNEDNDEEDEEEDEEETLWRLFAGCDPGADDTPDLICSSIRLRNV